MNLRGWISVVGLGMLMAGCAQGGTTTAMQATAKPEAKAVAQALLSGDRVQPLAVTERVRYSAEVSKQDLYKALGATAETGTYQGLKDTLSK